MKYLGSVDDQVSQAKPGRQEFSDDHAHQAEADIDLHVADDERDRAGKQYLKEHVSPFSAQ